MKKIYFVLAIVLLTSCQGGNRFQLEGVVEGGAGEMIYLEYSGLMKSTLLDSTRIAKDGSFHFRSKSPEYPDFYRLILGNKQIHFAVDSTETIAIKAGFDDFSNEYEITGSESNLDIQNLRKSVARIQRKANQMVRGLGAAEQEKLRQELIALIDEHKAMAKPMILKNPRSTAAYFAIYQQVNNTYIFSPYSPDDRPYCAAVATSYHTYMPNYDRTVNLYALVMDAIQTDRKAKQNEAWSEIVANATAGYIDIELPDHTGTPRRLSDLNGKVILLDFSAYSSRESVQYTFALRDLHNRYAARGFEIYQVSLDRNKMMWEDAVELLPWICVRDEDGMLTAVAQTYNVTSLPTYFLINREGDIVGRNIDIKTLEAEIEKSL